MDILCQELSTYIFITELKIYNKANRLEAENDYVKAYGVTVIK